MDTRLGRILEEERTKREKFNKEVKEKKERWIKLEEECNKWEPELREKDRDLIDREEGIRQMEEELRTKE